MRLHSRVDSFTKDPKMDPLPSILQHKSKLTSFCCMHHCAKLSTATTPFCRFPSLSLFISIARLLKKLPLCYEDKTERSLAWSQRGGSVVGLQCEEPVVGDVGQGRIWPWSRAGRTPSSHLDYSLLLMIRSLGT